MWIFLSSPASAKPPEDYIAGRYIAASPAPELELGGNALQIARRYAANIPGAFVVRGQGDSMSPLYPSGTVLVVQPQPYTTLQRGMTVMFRNAANRSITHVLVARTAEGWRTAGLKNRRDDFVCVNAGNIAGVVVAAYIDGAQRSYARN